jgi:Mrp family chromosome partitioning ATPase
VSAHASTVTKLAGSIPRGGGPRGKGEMTSRMAVDMIYQHSLAATVHELAARGARRLLVTSCEPGEGKSSVTADLGLALARSGRDSVMLVDADQFKPTLHRCLGLPPARGLGDLLDEVYLFDLTQENPDQFGIGDWLEILRAQGRSGELTISEGTQSCSLRTYKGSIRSISDPSAPEGTWIGDVLVRSGRITPAQRDEALRIHQESGRPMGDVLKTVGFITAEDIETALHEQAGQRIRRLIGFQRPECRFSELAEQHLPASGGRQPAVAEADGIDGWMSGRLRDYLRDPFLSSQVPSYFSDTPQPNLKVLTAGTRSCDLLAPRFHTAFQLLMNRLSRTFDMVLIDAPPVSLTTAAGNLASNADGVLLVVKADGAEVDGIRRAVEQLRRAGANILGVVLNQVDLTRDMSLSPYYRVLVGPR